MVVVTTDLVPVHVLAAVSIVVKLKPAGAAGNTSFKLLLNVATVGLSLVNVIVNLLVPPDGIIVGLKLLAIVVGLLTTKLACAGAGLTPTLVTSAPAGMLFTYVPATGAVTLTIIVHVPGVPRVVAAGITPLML